MGFWSLMMGFKAVNKKRRGSRNVSSSRRPSETSKYVPEASASQPTVIRHPLAVTSGRESIIKEDQYRTSAGATGSIQAGYPAKLVGGPYPITGGPEMPDEEWVRDLVKEALALTGVAQYAGAYVKVPGDVFAGANNPDCLPIPANTVIVEVYPDTTKMTPHSEFVTLLILAVGQEITLVSDSGRQTIEEGYTFSQAGFLALLIRRIFFEDQYRVSQINKGRLSEAYSRDLDQYVSRLLHKAEH